MATSKMTAQNVTKASPIGTGSVSHAMKTVKHASHTMVRVRTRVLLATILRCLRSPQEAPAIVAILLARPAQNRMTNVIHAGVMTCMIPIRVHVSAKVAIEIKRLMSVYLNVQQV